MTMQGERSDPDSTDDADAEVVSAYDGTDDARRLLVADITREEAWLSAPAGDAADLETWR